MRVNLTIGIPKWLDMIFVWPILLYRWFKYGYTYRRIYLGEGVWTILDQQDYYRLRDFKWWARGNGTNLYAVRSTVTAPGKTMITSMHREIMNAPSGMLVDHIHGDTLNNRRSELRLATHSQNMMNRRKTKSKTSSRFIGVSFSKRCGKWGVIIRWRHKRKWLGWFENEIDAAEAYDEAAIKYHKKFARLNFPEPQI